MINKDALISRLTIVKYLYQLGYEQSKQSESTSFICLLNFHDAVEMFLKLVAENIDIKSDGFNFSQYWEKIATLTMKEPMSLLNTQRVNLKHKGILPAKQDLERHRVHVTEFLEYNFKTQFKIEFKDVSLISLVSFISVREILEEAQVAIDNTDFEKSIEKSALAFYELIETYEQNKKKNISQSLFQFGERNIISTKTKNALRKLDNSLADNIEKLNNTVKEIQNNMKIMCLGVDYKKYAMFTFVTPKIYFSTGGHQVISSDYRKWTRESAEFCISFVIDTSLKLQEFDFDVKHLTNSPKV